MKNIIEKIVKRKKVVSDNTYLGRGYDYERGKPERIIIDKGHIFCAGATGSGKTNTMMYMMCQDISQGKSVVYIDPKGEVKIINKLVEISANKEVNRLDDIMVLNPFWENYSAKFNPLYCEGRYSVKDEVVNRIMTSIPETKEEFFRDMAFRILHTVIGCLSIKYGYNNLDYDTINKYMTHQNLINLCNNVSGYVEENFLKVNIDYFCNLNTEWYEKVIANASQVVSKISTGALNSCIGKGSDSTERSDILKRLYSDKKVIAAILIPSMKLHQTAQIAVKTVFAAIEGLVSEKIYQEKKLGLRIYIDEARDVLYRGCVRLLTQGRAADCFVRIFSQSIEGIRESVGEDEVNEILQNCKYRIIHKCDGLKTAELLLGMLADVPVQVASQDQDGETRTMGHLVKEVDPNDLARLEVGEYILIVNGKVKRGYCPEIIEPMIKVVEDRSEVKEKVLYVSYKMLAMDNWLEDKSEENTSIKREQNIDNIFQCIEKVLKYMENSYGKMININGKTDEYTFVAGKSDNINEQCVVLNVDIVVKNVKTFIENNVKDVYFATDDSYKDYISRYFINNAMLVDVEGKGIKSSKYNIYKVRLEYKDEMTEQAKSSRVDCWVIKSDKNVINESFNIYFQREVKS